MRWLLARSTAPLLSSKTVELTDVEMLWGTSRFSASSNTSERIGISVRMALLRLLYSDSKVDSEVRNVIKLGRYRRVPVIEDDVELCCDRARGGIEHQWD